MSWKNEKVHSWHREHPERVKELRDEHKIRNRKWFESLKKKLRCTRCRRKVHPVALDFHHPDPKKKDFNIGMYIGARYSRKRILEEIKKCIPLCANCHRIEHYRLRRQK